jgi:hypothetical protein
MTMRFHYRTISSYRILPPRWKYVNEDQDCRSPTDRYLAQVDRGLQAARAHVPSSGTDIASLVFANQLLGHEASSRQAAHLIEERRALTEKQLRDVQWRIDELWERKPFRPRGPGFHDDASLTEVERQILNLEWQKRALELALWRDTQELRANLVKERSEREATRRRISYLVGEYDGRA